MAAIKVAVLGSTGSIGTQTLEVIAAANAAAASRATASQATDSRNPASQTTDSQHTYEVVALSAVQSTELLARQIAEFSPEQVAVGTNEAANNLNASLNQTGSARPSPARPSPASGSPAQPGCPPEILVGEGALAALSTSADVVVNAVVGFAGLEVTLAALRAGKRLALANKESLIAAGPLCQPLRKTPGAEIIPVDSEHCALHQCLNTAAAPPASASPANGSPANGSTADPAHATRPHPPAPSHLVLTASGGPFLGRTAQELAAVTVQDALAHPTWQMGPKITVDSSTLMNKGLEVIEAHELFGTSYDNIEVVVHPQSVVHSMVTFADGATLAQLSLPDMRLPIGYALAYPNRLDVAFGAIDWAALSPLTFAAPDRKTFRCLDLATAAGRTGGTAPAWLNGANEAAVAAFLDGAIAWHQIAELLAAALDAHDGQPCDSVEAVIAADHRGRNFVAQKVASL